MNEPTKDLLRSLKTTAGARFNAAKRVSFVDTRLTALTAFSSSLVLALTVYPTFIKLSSSAQSWVGLTTVALSVLLLVSSLLQYSCKHAVNAELFHRSALDIQELKRELQYKADIVDEATFTNVSKRYNEILQRYSLNHDDVDFYRQQLEYPDEFPMARLERLRKSVKVSFAYHYPSFILVFVALMTLGIAFVAFVWPPYN